MSAAREGDGASGPGLRSGQEIFIDETERESRHTSDAIRFGDLLFLSGFGAVDPTGAIVGDDIRTQARYTLSRIGDALAAAGATPADVLEMTTFLTDVSEWELIRDIRKEFFDGARPATTLVGVTGLAVPGMRIEIRVVAGVPGSVDGRSGRTATIEETR